MRNVCSARKEQMKYVLSLMFSQTAKHAKSVKLVITQTAKSAAVRIVKYVLNAIKTHYQINVRNWMSMIVRPASNVKIAQTLSVLSVNHHSVTIVRSAK